MNQSVKADVVSMLPAQAERVRTALARREEQDQVIATGLSLLAVLPGLRRHQIGDTHARSMGAKTAYRAGSGTGNGPEALEPGWPPLSVVSEGLTNGRAISHSRTTTS